MAMIIQERWATRILTSRQISHRLLEVRINTPKGTIKWIAAHAPHMGRPEGETKHNFYNQLKETALKHPKGKIIILADFNAE
eukprot:12933858-Prorocentrum_lima.AAC.1